MLVQTYYWFSSLCPFNCRNWVRQPVISSSSTIGKISYFTLYKSANRYQMPRLFLAIRKKCFILFLSVFTDWSYYIILNTHFYCCDNNINSPYNRFFYIRYISPEYRRISLFLLFFCLCIWRISLLVNLQSQYEKKYFLYFFFFLDSTHVIMIIIISIHPHGNSRSSLACDKYWREDKTGSSTNKHIELLLLWLEHTQSLKEK
jgi:hypothetical protein